MEYKETLQLPKTKFPMRADLKTLEPHWQQYWRDKELYRQIQEQRKGRPAHVVHDGPPYANGDIHFGHILNKVIKDFVVRFYTMNGFNSPFIPGWDCHGLPIEHKVAHKQAKNPMAIREQCRLYAERWVQTQKEQFQRLGCLGDWDHPYLTMDRDYEATVITALIEMSHAGLLERKLRPIAWCAHDQTALAEAELEYKDHTSEAMYVLFPAMGPPVAGWPERIWRFMAWTTTPWTLPGNRALAINPAMEYVGVTYSDCASGLPIYAVLAAACVEKVMALTDRKFNVIVRCTGKDLEGGYYRHPTTAVAGRIFSADFVTEDTGTGIVHIAPAYGWDDYLLSRKYNIALHNDIGPDGTFQEGEYLKGLLCSAAGNTIKRNFKHENCFYYSHQYTHSCPHCWRCHEPTITRSVPQWFVNIDAHNLRTSALEELTFNIAFVPAAMQNRILGMVQNRPDWCISRQRYWGIPIPSCVCTGCGFEFMHEQTMLSCKIDGVEDWMSRAYAQEPLESPDASGVMAPLNCPSCGAVVRRGHDILDVWFESGCSHMALRDRLPLMASITAIEGTDQHRGWFQSSLLCGIGAHGLKPFDVIVTHGFALDKEMHPLAKSKGDTIGSLIETYGADVLRLYVASQDFTTDFVFSEQGVKDSQEIYRKIRNTFRYMLGNLQDMEDRTTLSLGRLNETDYYNMTLDEDFYIIHQLNVLIEEVTQACTHFHYYRAVQAIYHFCNVDLSSLYFDIIKDRLYCESEKSPSRTVALMTMILIYHALVRLIAPFIPHTAEDLWTYTTDTESVHLKIWPTKIRAAEGRLGRSARFKKFLTIRDKSLLACEILRRDKRINTNQGATICIWFDANEFTAYNDCDCHQDTLTRVCGVSEVQLTHDVLKMPEGEGSIRVTAAASENPKCPRCWAHRPLTEQGLCARCAAIIPDVDTIE